MGAVGGLVPRLRYTLKRSPSFSLLEDNDFINAGFILLLFQNLLNH